MKCVKMNPKLTRRLFCESGAVTVEAALWLPFLLILFFALGELALVFYGQARVLEVAQDGTRLISVGEILTAEEANTYITSRLSNLSDSVTTWSAEENGLITTVVKIPVNDFAPFGFFTRLASFDVTVVAQQVPEFGK